MAIQAETWLAESTLRISRPHRIAERVVCVGGLPGCGKTMLTPIIATFGGVEIQKFNMALEYVAKLRIFKVIDPSAATGMIRLLVDMDLYNMTMAREINLRPSDASSIFKNPGTLRYLKRLFQPGDAVSLERIRSNRPMLHLTIHNVLAMSPPLFEALGEGLRVIEVVRHPLYMIRQWRLYVERYGSDARDFTLWLDHDGRTVPFFARGWEERYLASSPMDRAIYGIERLLAMGRETLEHVSETQRRQVLVLPFEPFVLDPSAWMEKLERVLGTPSTRATCRELKRQRVPRKRVAAGLDLPIYRQYGWEPPERGGDERKELEKRRAAAASEASAGAMTVLDRLSSEYEATYWPRGSWR